jgi:hypothetical protein
MTASSVVKLAAGVAPAEDGPQFADGASEKEDVAVGTVMEFAIGQGKSLQLQTCFGRDEPIAVWNETLDKMREAGERQKLFTDLRSCEANLELQARELATSRKQVQAAEQEFVEMEAARENRVLALRVERDQYISSKANEYGRTGRRGEYEPKGVDASWISAKDREIAKEAEAQAKAAQDRENALKSQRAQELSIAEQTTYYEGEIRRIKERLSL